MKASIVSHGILSPSPSTGQQGETKGGRSMDIASHGSMYDTITSDEGRRIDNPTVSSMYFCFNSRKRLHP